MPGSYQTITLSYTNPDGVVTSITVARPETGNRDITNPRQEVKRTLGGSAYVYTRGPRLRQFEWKFASMNVEERANLEKFFAEGRVDQGRRWFTVSFEPTTYEVWVCGGIVGGKRTPGQYNPRVNGAIATCGSTRAAGERILMDRVTYYVRLITPDFAWDETEDGYFDLDLTVEVMGDFLPDNAT